MPSKFSARTWGTRFDSLPLSSPPLASPKSSAAATENVGQLSNPVESPLVEKVEKTSHDASVFVGSLPINVDHKELSAMLSRHLSEFAQVKSVKVIRDSKGGVCAFVQCEDADSATRLIQTLQTSPPKPFFGRILRFEPARAYRSLLISYRTPTQKVISTNENTSAESIVELTLPTAMRINKFKSSKSAAIFYNDEAIHMETQAEGISASTHEMSFFQAPVFCDAATLKAICGFFGPLEHFLLLKTPGNDGIDDEDLSSYPAPHDAPRQSHMDQGCFDVKWTQRDDCMSAFMALRRVPHLTVTWAHVAPEREILHQPYPTFPRVRSVLGTGHSSVHSPRGLAPRPNTTDSNNWKIVPQPQSVHPDTILIPQDEPDCNQGAVCPETDFPPLADHKTHFHSNFGGGVWIEKEYSAEFEKEKTERGFVDESTLGTTPPGASPKMLCNVHHLRSDYRSVSISTSIPDSTSQELELQLTPALARSPVTPKTPGSLFPPTPTSFNDERPTLYLKETDDEFSYRTEGVSDEQVLDPTTLFVGGLEMRGAGAWDEGKVYRLFKRFGGLETVKVIRPSSGKAAFAFVTFTNTEGPARAIAELHNHLVEGRPIRVQLRDCNPSRPFRVVRGRGRYPLHHGHQFLRSHQSESKRDKSVDASLGKSVTEVIETSCPQPSPFEPASETTKNAEPNAVGPSHKSDVELPTPQMQEPEPYREWYDVENHLPDSVATPSVGNSFTLEGGPGMPYPFPAFYAPGPWMQQYPPHAHYPMAFYPPIYAVPPNPHPPRYSGSSGSDASGPTSCPPLMPQVPWSASANYGYIPYHGFPQVADSSSPQGQDQAPVVPAGFFRDEAGTLIPVYPRAIIDQYMTNNPSQSNSPPVGVTVTVPATVPSPIPVPPSGPIQAWVPPGPPMFGHGPNQFPSRMGPLGQPSGWITPGQSMNSQAHHAQGFPPSFAMPMIGPPFREGFHSGMGQGNGHKRQGRRDNFHAKRNNGTRGRGSGAAVTNPTHVDGRLNSNRQVSEDWTHWPEAHQGVGIIPIS
ncbi:MAG: hypothetical protein NXY57DRAFT_391627 [Lentinula lateritia]|nr:MAG: hypothetical protein NXY57DRAFT_391627 [Lentinula lateritia]